MLRLLIVLVALAALAAWIVAMWAATSIFRIAPPGRKVECWQAVGLWQFGKVRSIVGPSAEIYIRSYRSAFIAFFTVILSVIIFTFLMAWPS